MVWWSLGAAFVFMLVLVLAANLFADAVRDAFDPRVRVGRRCWRSAKAGMSATLLKVEDLATRLETASGIVRAIDGVDLEIARGETFALVGESGCGKIDDRAVADAAAARDRGTSSAARCGSTARTCSRCPKRRCATCAAGASR